MTIYDPHARRLPPLPSYLDSSMLVQFRSCPRKFAHEYIYNLRPPGRKVDLVAGGAFAGALEAAYQEYFNGSRIHSRALQRAWLEFRKTWGDFPDTTPGSMKSFDRTFGAVLDYFDTYPFETDHVQPLLRDDGSPSYEFSFAIPLDFEGFPRHPSGDPFLYCGRFDAFGRYGDKMVIRDEKTSGRAPTQRWSDTWDLRNQFLGYVWASQIVGYPVDTVVVRGVTIQKTQYYQTEAVKVYPNFMIERFFDQLKRDVHRLVDCYNSGYFDFNLGDTCTNYGLCSYHLLCSQPDPELWFGEYDREVWNPLTRTTTPVDSDNQEAA